MSKEHEASACLLNWSMRWAIAFVCCGAVAGCGGDKEQALFDSVNGSNIQRVANLYCVFQSQHNFVGPKDEAALKAYISSMPESRLAYYKVDAKKVDEIFISERDKKPFKIRLGLKAKGRQGPIPIAFEQEGVDGKYMVAFSSFEIREVEKPEYDELWSGKRDEVIAAETNRGQPR